MTDNDIKQQVREFYDQVGWSQVAEGVYQNARYEDLRPVAREYIHKCHLRILRHIPARGRYLLDAGSGPIQYPEYLEYSKGYEKRVCADISITALKEARARIGEHGMFVVADIARLPFKDAAFDGLVTLHTIHHLPPEDHVPAYRGLHRVLAAGGRGAVVNGWRMPPLEYLFALPILVRQMYRRIRRGEVLRPRQKQSQAITNHRGTHVKKYNARWLEKQLFSIVPLRFFVWRSMSVPDMQLYFHERLGGRLGFRLLYWIEELFPHFMGRNGLYPLIIIWKEKE